MQDLYQVIKDIDSLETFMMQTSDPTNTVGITTEEKRILRFDENKITLTITITGTYDK